MYLVCIQLIYINNKKYNCYKKGNTKYCKKVFKLVNLLKERKLPQPAWT